MGCAPAYPLILVIENEDLIRSMCRLVLERNRFRVICAEDGARGLACYRDRLAEIDLVLCDLRMPEMSGPEVVREIRALNHSARIIVMTGYDVVDVVSGDLDRCRFLNKPFTSDRLIRAVEDALAWRAGSSADGT
jgi:DNA-binding NtrC family response regulator